MIGKTHRFRGHNSLRFAYQRGEVVRGTYCSLKHVTNPRRETFRAAVVVSRKVHKSAAVRNRIRRRIYELVRLEAGRMPRPADLVFTVYSEQVALMPAKQLQQVISGQLLEAGLISAEVTPPSTPNHDIVVPKET